MAEFALTAGLVGLSWLAFFLLVRWDKKRVKKQPITSTPKEPFAGPLFGGLAAAITFLAVYIAAIGSIGWVFGIALGWIPAGLASVLAYAVFRYLWWLFLVLALLAIAKACGA